MAKNNTSFKVVRHDDPGEFEKLMNKALEEGWELHGLTHLANYDGINFLVQSLTKSEIETKEYKEL